MSQTTLIIIGFAGLALLQWYLNTRQSTQPHEQSFSMMQEQLSELRKTVDDKLGKSRKEMHETVKDQFSESRKLIKEVTEELTEVKKTSEQVFDITKSLEDLEKVLKNQKRRGSLGEAGLELTLQNVLPHSAYDMQYTFDDGEAVDAVIHAPEGLIPIDAKFSLDNYQRLVNAEDDEKRKKLQREFKNDLKNRINETAKYIREDAGTLPFALMYIPAEGIYYDLLVNEVGSVQVNTRSLIEYALKEKKVVIVSPTTLLAYLHTILQGLRSMQISEHAERIQEGVESLRKHFTAFEDRHQRLGSSLNTVVNHYDKSNVKLRGLGRDVEQIIDADFELDGKEVDNPRLDE
jgi:DNA recombination protein RmuC